MKNLNRASFDVWTEYMKDYNRQNITDRILFLDTFDKLTEEEESELGILLNLEKKFINESEEAVDGNKRYLRVFNHYKDILEKHADDRLLTIFFERVSESLLDTEVCNEKDLKRIYIDMMEEDMDVNGHENLTKFYEEIKKEEDAIGKPCGDPDCIYCRAIDDTEYADAIDDLTEQGFFDNILPDKELFVKLMVTIHRLQDELAIYKPGDGDHFEFDDEDDEDL